MSSMNKPLVIGLIIVALLIASFFVTNLESNNDTAAKDASEADTTSNDAKQQKFVYVDGERVSLEDMVREQLKADGRPISEDNVKELVNKLLAPNDIESLTGIRQTEPSSAEKFKDRLKNDVEFREEYLKRVVSTDALDQLLGEQDNTGTSIADTQFIEEALLSDNGTEISSFSGAVNNTNSINNADISQVVSDVLPPEASSFLTPTDIPELSNTGNGIDSVAAFRDRLRTDKSFRDAYIEKIMSVTNEAGEQTSVSQIDTARIEQALLNGIDFIPENFDFSTPANIDSIILDEVAEQLITDDLLQGADESLLDSSNDQ